MIAPLVVLAQRAFSLQGRSYRLPRVAVVVATVHDPMLAISTAVILAVLAGAEMGGIAGMFIAVPVVALLTVLVRHWLDWRGGDAESLAAAAAPS